MLFTSRTAPGNTLQGCNTHGPSCRVTDGRVQVLNVQFRSCTLRLFLLFLLGFNTSQPLVYASFPITVARLVWPDVGSAPRRFQKTKLLLHEAVMKLLRCPPFWRQAVSQRSLLRPTVFEPIWRSNGTIKAFLNRSFLRTLSALRSGYE